MASTLDRLTESKHLSLRVNFSWTMMGNVLYAATQWGMIMLFTKSFSAEIFGRYALGLSISTPIFAFSTLQLRNVLVSEQKNHTSFIVFFTIRCITSSFAFLVLIGICLIGAIPKSAIPVTLAIGIGQGIVTIKDIFQALIQREERMDIVAISMIIQGGLSIFSIATLVILTDSIVEAMLGMAAAELIVLVLFDIPMSMRVRSNGTHLMILQLPWENLSFNNLFFTIKLALPLGVVTLLLTLHTSIPRYVLAMYHGEEVVGYFTAISTFMTIENMIISALGQSSARQLAIHHGNNPGKFRYLLSRLALLGFTAGAFAVVLFLIVGRQVIELFFQREYGTYFDVLIWLLIGRIILNVLGFMGYGITAARYFAQSLWVYGPMTAILILSSLLLIPQKSGIGAAWSILISAIFGLAASLVVLRREISIQRNTA